MSIHGGKGYESCILENLWHQERKIVHGKRIAKKKQLKHDLAEKRKKLEKKYWEARRAWEHRNGWWST
jgi:hypothetical protein